MFDTSGLMTSPSRDVTAALATLQSRWGAAAPRRGAQHDPAADAVVGALATLPVTDELETPAAPLGDGLGRIVSTGFPELDAILGPGGVPRTAAVALRGAGSSGTTTLALRLVAETQGEGGIAAWVDLARSLDPIEAVARGVNLEWLVALVPDDLDEGLSMAAALLSARTVDLLVLDLPVDRPRSPTRGLTERFSRLSALARRAGTLLVVLEPPLASKSLAEATAGSTGLRLELEHRSWIRLGRDVVGQRTEVVVARNRYGPPGRRAELRILYADGGPRDACLARTELLTERSSLLQLRIPTHATPPPPLAPPSTPTRPIPLHHVPDRPGRPRRPAMDGRDGHRREPGRARARRPPGHAARHGASAGARGDLPRSRA
jgi:hypothetical protein